jgi:hypothetical protein
MEAHNSFDMDASGAQLSWGFTKAEDAAIYAQHLHVNRNMGISEARLRAAERLGVDRRDIERAFTVVKHKHISISGIAMEPQTLALQAEFILLKY